MVQSHSSLKTVAMHVNQVELLPVFSKQCQANVPNLVYLSCFAAAADKTADLPLLTTTLLKLSHLSSDIVYTN